MNWNLKRALLEDGREAWAIAASAGISPSVLSRIVQGHRPTSATERRNIAAALNRPVDLLFPFARLAALSRTQQEPAIKSIPDNNSPGFHPGEPCAPLNQMQQQTNWRALAEELYRAVEKVGTWGDGTRVRSAMDAIENAIYPDIAEMEKRDA